MVIVGNTIRLDIQNRRDEIEVTKLVGGSDAFVRRPFLYNGFWYAPERELLQGLIDEAQQRVSGTARLKLYKGNVTVTGRKSPNSLFSEDFATFEKDTVYNQKDAEGFIKINALRLKIRSLMQKAR